MVYTKLVHPKVVHTNVIHAEKPCDSGTLASPEFLPDAISSGDLVPHAHAERLPGLDLLRASAIAMVLLAHYPKASGGLAARALNFGWTGVDLFFVLSGYLIAGQLFKSLIAEGSVDLANFYGRRFFRTLPNYYAIVIVYTLLAVFAVGTLPRPDWKFLALIQNFGNPRTFPVSWSLCVEEQFYLCFPLVALMILRLKRPHWFLYLAPAVLCTEFVLRSLIWFITRPDLLAEPQALASFMGNLYYPTYCRIDGIALGVGLAALKSYRPQIWQQWMDHGNRLLGASTVVLAAAIVALWSHYSFLCSTIGITLLNVSFALLVASALSKRSLLSRIRLPGIQAAAVLSYSIYLTHSLAMDAGELILTRLHESSQSMTGVAFIGMLVLLFSSLLYATVERPAMALRDRLPGKNQSRRGTRTAEPILEDVTELATTGKFLLSEKLL